MKERISSIKLMDAVREVLERESRNIIKDNKTQLELGQTSDGNTIVRSYASKAYAEMKQQMNSKPPMGTPDLRLTGAFYGGFYFQIDGDSYTISSHDEKTEELERKYGEDIFGLNPDNKQEIKEQVNSQLRKYVQSKISR